MYVHNMYSLKLEVYFTDETSRKAEMSCAMRIDIYICNLYSLYLRVHCNVQCGWTYIYAICTLYN